MPLEYGGHDQCFSKNVPYNTSCAWYEAGINDGTILENTNPEIQNCNCKTLFYALGNLGCAKEQKLLESYIIGFCTLAVALIVPQWLFLKGRLSMASRRARKAGVRLVKWLRAKTTASYEQAMARRQELERLSSANNLNDDWHRPSTSKKVRKCLRKYVYVVIFIFTTFLYKCIELIFSVRACYQLHLRST